jgi:hypothetical protein
MLSTSYSADFDLTFLHGLKIGLTKQEAIKILEKDSIKFIEKNNNVGGKYTVCTTKYFIDSVAINEMTITFSKNKIDFIMFPLDPKKLWQLDDILDLTANCRLADEEVGYRFYIFDNCNFSINFELDALILYKPKLKCKGN